jgi:UV DNA damage endonuclease
MMDADPDSVMVVHGGGMYCPRGSDLVVAKKKTLERWVRNYWNLPIHVRKRIVLENCERCYSVDDLLPICLANGIPLVLDIHHYDCYSKYHPDEVQTPLDVLFPDIIKTWAPNPRNGVEVNRRMKLHISEQGEGRCGHHSDYIERIPQFLFEFSKLAPFDLMIEAKMKERAIQKLYQLYPELVPDTMIILKRK